MSRLTIESVQTAINELKAQGKKPTNKNIVTYLGFGSFSTLAIFRKKYPNVFNDTIPNTFFNTVTVDDNLVQDLWKQLEPRIKECIQTVLPDTKDTDKECIQTVSPDTKDTDKECIQTVSPVSKDTEKWQKPLSKLVFLVTTGKFGEMIGNKELGEIIELSPSDIANLKRKGKNFLYQNKK